MKTILIALALGVGAGMAGAASEAPAYSPQVSALRYECAAKYYPAQYSSRYYSQLAYDRGEYKGKSECSDQQYAAYLETVDPTRVMSAYPSAAGKPPGYKYDKAYKPDSYSKDSKDYDQKYDKDHEKYDEKK